jgi:copper chaperone CopZ
MKLQLKVPNMSCGGCVSQTKTVSVETQSPEAAIKEAMAKVGYRPS